MIEVTVNTEINRSAEHVFGFLSDWSNNPKWQLGMKSCTWTSEPPMQLGSTYDQEASFMGKTIISSFEVVEFESGKSVRIRTTKSSMPLDITRKVEAIGDANTKVTAIIRGEPKGAMAFLNPLMKRMVQRNVDKDYARLKQLLEMES